MDRKKYLLPLLGFLLLGTAAPAVEFFDGRANVAPGAINITTDKLLFSDVSAAAGSRIKNITPATLRTDLDLLTITAAAATYLPIGGPATVSELTVTDFITASGLNLAIGDITLGTTINYTDNVRQTFNPGATVAGLNVGSYAGNPSTPTNGDIWYNSSATTLNARINGATVSLGAGIGDAVLGTPATFTELTATDFLQVNGNISGTDLTLTSTLNLPDNVRQTFNPGAAAPGLNVGSYAGNPSTPSNGDLWYNSTANTLRARINGATVDLGAGSVDVGANYTWTGTHDFSAATVTLPNFTSITTTGLTTTNFTLGGTAITATGAELNALDGITSTVTELNYTDGVTSAIQTQLDAKAPLASPTFTGTPAAPTAAAGTNTTQLATTAGIVAERTATATLTGKSISAVTNTITGTGPVNVRASPYLATGDGTTDDTAAIVAAAAASKDLYFPPGTYIIDTFSPQDGTRITGAGVSSILKKKSATTGYIIDGTTNTIHVSSLALDGGVVADQTANVTMDLIHGLYLWADEGAVAENLTVYNFDGAGIYMLGDTNITNRINRGRVSNCTIQNCQTGIRLGDNNAAEYTRVAGNKIRKCYWGLVIPSANVTVTANDFTDCGNGWYSRPTNGRSHSIYSGNTCNHSGVTFYDCATGATVVGNQFMGSTGIALSASGFPTPTTEDVSFMANYFENPTVTDYSAGNNVFAGNTTSNGFAQGGTRQSKYHDNYLTTGAKVTSTATLAAAATAIAVPVGDILTVTGDAGANTVATITGGAVGMERTLFFVDALVTITDTAAATADTVNLSAAFTSSANDTLTLIYVGNKWYEKSRSVN